jgi:cytochrome c-type biogenesis protein CcmH/NrfF
MGYTWAIPVVIVVLLLIVVALGARRRRRSGAHEALNKDKPVVP